jgi:hypothetical protein
MDEIFSGATARGGLSPTSVYQNQDSGNQKNQHISSADIIQNPPRQEAGNEKANTK